MYPPELTAPMAKELNDNGFQSLTTAADVETLLSQKEGTVFIVVNSVCGCAAANARPGAMKAVENAANKPDNLVTVFAGVDKDAVNKAREFFLPYPPSSPCMGLFKNGQLVHFLERRHIEGASADLIAENMKVAFDHHCA